MSRQADLVPEIIRVVASCAAPIGMVLGGSVAEGCERTDSDLDLFAVVDSESQPDIPGFTVFSVKNGCKVFERKDGPFPVHVACWTTMSMDEILQARPYMMYPFAIGRIVLRVLMPTLALVIGASSGVGAATAKELRAFFLPRK